MRPQNVTNFSVTKNLVKDAKMNAKWFTFNALIIVRIIVACLSALEFTKTAITVVRAVINAPMVAKIAPILFVLVV